MKEEVRRQAKVVSAGHGVLMGLLKKDQGRPHATGGKRY